MLIYIHGFGSSGFGGKAQQMKAYCAQQGIAYMAPSLSTIPTLAVTQLADLIEAFLRHEKVGLVGSSLGGFYAQYLADKYAIPAVLINPAVFAHERLLEALGSCTNYFDGSKYEWNQGHVDMLANYAVTQPPVEKLWLLAQTGDEVLDYREAETFLKGAKQTIEVGGDHSFQGLDRHFQAIIDFLDLA
jgi:predicted esterase YcpF (UPF0227 family)